MLSKKESLHLSMNAKIVSLTFYTIRKTFYTIRKTFYTIRKTSPNLILLANRDFLKKAFPKFEWEKSNDEFVDLLIEMIKQDNSLEDMEKRILNLMEKNFKEWKNWKKNKKGENYGKKI